MRGSLAAFFAMVLMIAPALAAPGNARNGEQIFRTCAGCHSTETDAREPVPKKMGPPLRSLFGRVTLRNGRRADDDNVRAIVLDGYHAMPAFRYSFRPSEIDDLMAYLHTLTAKPSAAGASEGESYFRAYCIRCHDPASRTSAGPTLRGRFQTDAIRRIEGGHAGAPPLRDWLNEDARRQLFEYLKRY